MKHLISILVLVAMCQGFAVHAETLSADEIATRAYERNRVDDQIATLTFTFSSAGKKEQQVAYTMVWKNMKGKDGYDNKAMFFGEFPTDKRGIAYLGWLTPAGSAKQDSEWIYLPELRTTRRIAHRGDDKADDDDEFANSLLKREHLDPRPPSLDTHTLVGEEMLDGRAHYVILSTPKQRQKDESAKTVRWVDRESFRVDRAQYFDVDSEETLDVDIVWSRVGQFWVWKNVTAVSPKSGAKTVLEVDTISINSGLKDRDFSKRNLKRGSAGFRR